MFNPCEDPDEVPSPHRSIQGPLESAAFWLPLLLVVLTDVRACVRACVCVYALYILMTSSSVFLNTYIYIYILTSYFAKAQAEMTNHTLMKKVSPERAAYANALLANALN